jgi:Flp pilus assembly protein TadD
MPTSGRPLVFATLALNHELNQALGVDERPDPDGPSKAVSYRLFNLLVHLLTGALLFAFLRRAMREPSIPPEWSRIADPIAGIVTALWLLHPIQSEVINYVVQRTEGLSSMFYVATLYASQRAWDAPARRRIVWYVLAVAACALGMLCKEILITAPLAVMLYDRAFRASSWNELIRLRSGRAGLYIALASASVVTFVAFSLSARGDSAGFGQGMTWYAYLYTQCWVIPHYLRLIVWPEGLAPDYGFHTIHGLRGIPGAILLGALAAGTLAAWRRVERFGWLAFSGSMFFLLLAPSSSVIPVVTEVGAERRVYLALAALLVPTVVGIEWVRRRMAANSSGRAAAACAAGIASALCIATFARSRTYADPELFWRRAVTAMPENPRALEELGMVLFMRSPARNQAAESVFVKATSLDSSCETACLPYSALLMREGRFAEAVALLERERRDVPDSHFRLAAQKLLALGWMKLGKYDRAVPYLERVVQADPTLSNFVTLGVSYLSVGRRDEAVSTFRSMATYDPGNAQLRRLSERLQDGVNHPEALSNIQDFAFTMTQGWF